MPFRDENRRISARSVVGLSISLTALLLSCVFVFHGALADEKTERAGQSSKKPARQQHPLVPALAIARTALEKVEQSKDFEAILDKHEVVKNRVSKHKMHIKLRHKPFSVYLRFFEPHAGREVIFVDGKNQGKLLAHEAGIKALAGTVALSPNSPEAMSESRYPITRIGIANMVKGVIAQWETEKQYGECQVKYYPNAKLGSLNCQVIESTHPKPRRQFRFHMTRLYIDKKSGFPVRVEQHGFPKQPGAKPPVLEEYTYQNLKVNVGLKDVDFDPRNPKYRF